MNRNNLYLPLVIFIFLIFPSYVFADSVKGEEIRKISNDYIKADFPLQDEFYLKSIKKGKYSLNYEALEGTLVKDYHFNAFVYGYPHGDEKNGISRYLGYTVWADDYLNPDYPNDRKLPGKIPELNWVHFPWRYPGQNLSNFSPWKEWKKNIVIKDVGDSYFDYDPEMEDPHIEDKYRQSFILGLEKSYSKEELGENYKKIKWEEIYHVIQPPTLITDGLASIYHCEKNDSAIWYQTVPLIKFSEVYKPDYSVTVLRTGTEDNLGAMSDITKKYTAVVECRIDNYIQGIASKPVVKVCVNGGEIVNQVVEFDEKKFLVDDYKFWGQYNNLPETPELLREDFIKKNTYKLTEKAGNSWAWLNSVTRDKDYRASDYHKPMKSFTSGEWYKVSDNTGDDVIKRIAKKYLIIEWKPIKENTNVTISCSITPENNSIDNNQINNNDTVVIPWLGPPNKVKYFLDYDELSKDFSLNLSKGDASSASIPVPESLGCSFSYSWKSDARTSNSPNGALNINLTGDSNIVESKSITENDNVDSNSISASRVPNMSWTTERTSFGDIPDSKSNLLGTQAPTKIVKLFGINSLGSTMFRGYNYSYFTGCYTDENGNHVHGSLNSGDDGIRSDMFFPPINENVEITAYVYNGKSLPGKAFSKSVTGDQKSFNKHIEWTSEAIDLSVHRRMKNVDVNGKIKGGDSVIVPGKFTRKFSNTNTADIKFEPVQTLADWFKSDIVNAKNGIHRGDSSYFPHAPFASDDWCKKISYPFKSGYYLNPGGTYKVTVTTAIFKNGADGSKEHEQLVKNIMNVFRYYSSLQYVNATNMMYQIKYPDNSGNLVKFTTDYTNPPPAKKLKYSDSDAGTDKEFKEVMEGWSESGTSDSFSKYKYREFVSSSNIYKVTETTTIYIHINQNNQKYYTYFKMPGDKENPKSYNITAGFNDFILNGSYFNPISVSGVKELDKALITVVGNIYDDLVANRNQ